MKKYKSLLSVSFIASTLLFSGCKDDFTEINQPKDAISIATPAELFVQSVFEFETNPYMLWFANARGFLTTAQMAVPSGSMTQDAINGGMRQGFQSISVLKYVNALKYELSVMSAEEAAKYQKIAAAMDVMSVFLGIYDTDDCGDIPFTEAANARYGGTLTPKYDHVADLYVLWLTMLDNSITTFTTAADQIDLGNQDIIYNGDWNKWAKLANSIKLKIAVRLIYQDFTKAKEIASAVATASCGVLDGAEDDFLFHKADERVITADGSSLDGGDVAYGTTNTTIDYAGICASQNMVNFMLKNHDPRVRFLYEKNSWNSKVVDYYLKNGQKSKIPSFIMENVETQVVDGAEGFKAWKGDGEPWVRYYGLPDAYNAANDNAYGEYYQYSVNTLYENYSFRPYSTFNEELVQGRIDFTLPTAPGDAVIQDRDDNPIYRMYMTTSEVNLYLAEFAIYGAVSGNASTYFDKAVRASVEEWNRLASLNKIPYYGTTYSYDPNEVVIDLKAGEVDALMANADYKLTGDKDADLEKIFLQQLIHFSYQPKELFVTARRSGVPKFNSTLFPRTNYGNDIPVTIHPRRTAVSEPLQGIDLMYDVIKESYEYQGFTSSLAAGITHDQRVWQDMGAPEWGAGPINK